MGGAFSKCCSMQCERSRKLRAKIMALEEEIKQERCARERDVLACVQHSVDFSRREEEWRRERSRYKDEAARLRLRLKEEEARRRRLEVEVAAESSGDKVWQQLGADFLVEHMKEEQARREETVEKWKQLYLSIKTELDDLIQRTHQGERWCWGAGHGVVEGLQREMEAKDEAVERLRSKIAALEKEGVKKDREIDILRQSLRILSCSKRSRNRKSQSRPARVAWGRDMGSL